MRKWSQILGVPGSGHWPSNEMVTKYRCAVMLSPHTSSSMCHTPGSRAIGSVGWPRVIDLEKYRTCPVRFSHAGDGCQVNDPVGVREDVHGGEVAIVWQLVGRLQESAIEFWARARPLLARAVPAVDLKDTHAHA